MDVWTVAASDEPLIWLSSCTKGTATNRLAFVLQTNVNKIFSIFLVLAVALSSVGMSVSQHFCTMSKKEIEASKCKMCSSEKHGTEKQTSKSDKKPCCSNESIHLRLDTDATHVAKSFTPQPLFTVALTDLIYLTEQVLDVSNRPFRSDLHLISFPLTEENTVLRV
jgi:hypothetical protein